MAMVSLTPDCMTGTTFRAILATYVGGQGGYYFSYKKDNALAATGTTTLSGLTAWTLFGSTFALNVTNAPVSTSPSAYLGQIADGEAFELGSTTNFLVVGGAMNVLRARASLAR